MDYIFYNIAYKTPKPQIKFWVLNKEEIIKNYKIYEVKKFI